VRTPCCSGALLVLSIVSLLACGSADPSRSQAARAQSPAPPPALVRAPGNAPDPGSPSPARAARCAGVAIGARNTELLPPRDVAPADLAEAEALARRMKAEAEALAAIAGDDGALLEASQAAQLASGAAWMVANRFRFDKDELAASVAHSLGVMLRRREHSHLVLRDHCNQTTRLGAVPAPWRERAIALVQGIMPALRACRESAPEDERLTELDVRVHLDPHGRVTLVAPVQPLFTPHRFGATDAAHCIIKLVEALRFPGLVPAICPTEAACTMSPQIELNLVARKRCSGLHCIRRGLRPSGAHSSSASAAPGGNRRCPSKTVSTRMPHSRTRYTMR
jgi:hypothetical protein